MPQPSAAPRQRARAALALCTTSLAALLAAGAAQAGAVTVNPVQTTTYTLSPSGNPITFGAGTNIDTSVTGVSGGSTTVWTVTNLGSIQSGIYGVKIGSASKITNSGLISGYDEAIVLGSGGKLTNSASGTITSSIIALWIGGPGTVVNSGHITGDIDITGGSVANNLGGVIAPRSWIDVGGTGTITNSGTINGQTGAVLVNAGKLTNTSTGVIEAGSEETVLAGGVTITNAGQILAPYGDAVWLGVGGSTSSTLTNQAQAVISAERYGVTALAQSKITNAGQIITWRGDSMAVLLRHGGTVTNQAGGQISGDIGVAAFEEISGSVNTIVNNAGATITGQSYGVESFSSTGPVTTSVTNTGLIQGPVGVRLNGGSVTNKQGGQILGVTMGVRVDTGAGAVSNAGVITGATAIQLDNGGTVTNSAGGVVNGLITGSGAIAFTNAGTWNSSGSSAFGGGSLTNTGTIHVGALSGPASTSAFTGFTSFHNGSGSATGTLSLANNTVGDVLSLSGPFIGANNHSELYLDAFLGGPGSQADQLQLAAGSSGQTLIRIFNTNSGPGAINSSGIALVTGATAASNFALDPKTTGYSTKYKGVLDGLVLYTLQFNGGTFALFGSAAPSAHQLSTTQSAGSNVLGSTDFSPGSGSGSAGASGFMGFTGSMGFAQSGQTAASSERPMFWTSAVGTLSSDPVRQGAFSGSPGQTPEMADPALRLTSISSSGGYSTGYDQGLSMLKGGVDLIRGKSFSLGFGAAYIQSDQRFSEGGTAMFYSGMVYGGYAAFSSGPAWAQLDVKSAMLQGQYAAPWLASQGHPAAGLNASGITLKGGSSFALAPGWSLEPIAEAAAQYTSMGDLQVGADLVRFKSAYDGWANAGARLTGQTRAFGYTVSTSLTARVWDRFGDQSTAYLQGDASPLVDRLNGVSGEVATELRISKGRNVYGFLETSARSGAAQKTAAALAGFAVKW